ncbi:MAG TPA: hypothetical protein VM123_16210 [archaeon]|nr:hypothetical protein [archaeon]
MLKGIKSKDLVSRLDFLKAAASAVGTGMIISTLQCASSEEAGKTTEHKGGTKKSKKRPEMKSHYLAMVRSYADTMIQYGRDRYGPEHSPLFAYALTRDKEPTLITKIPGESPDIRNADRTLGCANPGSQHGLYQLLYALEGMTGESRYSRAADEALKWFFEHAQSQETGLVAWGEHLGWHFVEECVYGAPRKDMLIHEFYEPAYTGFPLWERVLDLAPEAVYRFAEGLWEHQIHNHQTGTYSRHAGYDRHNTEPGSEFPRIAAYMLDLWSLTYLHHKDAEFRQTMLNAISSMRSAFDARRNPVSDALPFTTKEDAGCSPDQNVRWAIFCTVAAERLKNDAPEISAQLLDSARRTDEVISKIPYQALPGGKGIARNPDLVTLLPSEWPSLWVVYYGHQTQARYAMIYSRRYHQVPQRDMYRKMILDTVDCYLDEAPDARDQIWPYALAAAIELELEAYALTSEDKYLQRADFFGEQSRNLFFDEQSPLPKMTNQHDYYEEITGCSELMWQMLRLAQKSA